MTACYIFNLVCVNFLYYKYERFVPFIPYTKALHFEWQADRGATVRARERAVTNRSRVCSLPLAPLTPR